MGAIATPEAAAISTTDRRVLPSFAQKHKQLMLLIFCRRIVVIICSFQYMNPLQIQVSLGQVVRAKRSQFGYSQEAFADRVGLHRTYIGSFERGERNLSLQNLVRIANALELPLSSLLAEAEEALETKKV